MFNKRLIIVLAVMLLLAVSAFFAGCQPAAGPDAVDMEVTIGSKEFTEQLILGQITILALEEHGITTVDETGLGGTAIVREAQEAGDVDLYWEYTGTGLITHLGYDEVITDPDECYRVVKEDDLERNGLVWLDYTPFDNTYAVMMRRADAEAHGIVTVSDLAAAINGGASPPDPGEWVFGSNHEYSTRDDGYPGLLQHYGFDFDRVDVMDYGIIYSALRDEMLAAAMCFATDGRIPAFDLVVLVDDLQFHPVYNCAPVVRQETLEAIPQIADILNPIAQALDVDTMSYMNMLVDEEDYLPREVAENWLKEEGFIE